MATINTVNTVTIDELRKLIPAIGDKLTVVVQSEAGCGKTSLLKMIEQDHGDEYEYVYVDCPVKDMSDIAMTIPNHETKSLESYVGSLFKMDSPKPKVILLDEFMKSPKLLQVIFTRLMLERSIGDTPLPEGSIVFATSNNAGDGLGDTMLAHAGNRVCIVRMEKPDVTSWLKWAGENAINPLIRAWVYMFPRALASYLDGGQEDNPYIFNPSKHMLSFCSPRSLAKASVIVDNKDILGENATMVALAGTVGASASADMSAFIAMEKQLTPYDDIIKEPTTAKIPSESSGILMTMFQAVDKLETHDDLNRFMQYVNRIESSELQAVFFTMMCKSSKGIKLAKNNQQIMEWSANNHELF